MAKETTKKNSIVFEKRKELDYRTNESYKSLRTNIQFCGQEVKTTADLSLICGICEVAMERAD